MPRFAANLTMLFKEHEFLERFEQAAKNGFEAVEFLWPYAYKKQELKQILDDTHLTLALFNTTAGDTAKGEWGHAALPGRETEFSDEIEQALDYADALNCKTVHVMSAVVPFECERELCHQVFVANMRKAAQRASKFGVTLTMEALCPEIKRNYLYSSQYETMALAREIGCDNVKTQFDTFHAQMVDGNLTRLIRDFKGAYAHVQIAAAPSRQEPDEGEINYDYIFKLLDDCGYRGYVGCEYNPRTTTVAGLGWFEKWRKR